ncbi:MAG: hypothetical protein K2G60_04385 [Oscillospiraceae bacterium]|nr:hypothetical protein [Oscillospiraceae bacterium]
MKVCNKCSVANDDKAVFCTGCGAVLQNNSEVNAETPVISENPVTSESPAQQADFSQPSAEYTQPNTAYVQPQSPFVQPVGSQPAMPQMPYGQPYGYAPINENMLPEDYKPVTVWQYVGYTLLFSVPIIGFIMILVTAFGSDKSISLRNYAKSYLVWYAISVVLMVVMFFFIGMFAAILSSSPY